MSGFFEDDDYTRRIGRTSGIDHDAIFRSAIRLRNDEFRATLRQFRSSLSELHYLSRRPDVGLGFIYQEFCGLAATYERLLNSALAKGTNLDTYASEQEEIQQLVGYIEMNVRWKQYQESQAAPYQTPAWIRTLSGLADVADDALTAVGLRPMAGSILRSFLRILGLFTGVGYSQLGSGLGRRLLPP